jgi:LuxR family transcriptional regulator, maltose regulon positive regulatory protein
MASTGSVRLPATLHRRRIIERPRLLALLDASNTRVKLLVAPAGYGKSTLAEQWTGRDGRRCVWFTARPSSTDVAGLALGLAKVSTEVVPGCDERLRAHLRALPAPAENVEVLAEILGEDLETWPSDAWLVLDEYEHLSGTPDAERFASDLVALSPIQLMVATRQRPAWVTPRTVLYGQVLELNQTQLAMDSIEASEVLSGRSAESAAGLVELANGWPAVIGLASVSTAEVEGMGEVPESLYEFFAEEVFAALGDDVQAGLATLAVAPVIDRELARVLLGAQRADVVSSAALDIGILVERGSQLELHPLARSFLGERRAQRRLDSPDEAVVGCLEFYRDRGEWDAALDVIARHGLLDEAAPTLVDALDDLLDTARLSSLERWLELSRRARLEDPIFSLARAEVALRNGKCSEARAFAEIAASSGSHDTVFRALSLGGRAAHLASNEEAALNLYRRAEAAAKTEQERRDSLWGQVRCSIELELPSAAETLHHLTNTIDASNLREIVHAASCGLFYQQRMGVLDLAQAAAAHELIGVVADPLVVSGFRSSYSFSLGLAARYEEAQAVAGELLVMARRYRLEFAVPYALNSAAVAHAGLRQWSSAEACCHEATALARARNDANAEQFVYSVYVRLLVQQGLHQRALTAHVPPLQSALAASRAEVQLSRALALASAGRVAEARGLACEIHAVSVAIEPTVLRAAVDAICAIHDRDANATETVATLVETAFSTGALDLLVSAYRSTPALLALMLRSASCRDRVAGLVRRIHDDDLAREVGCGTDTADPRSLLTARERDVYALLCQGLTNTQIAKTLFIEESTVKIHARHIYGKLGVRSRTALAVQAALARDDQATSAMDVTGAADGGSPLL